MAHKANKIVFFEGTADIFISAFFYIKPGTAKIFRLSLHGSAEESAVYINFIWN